MKRYFNNIAAPCNIVERYMLLAPERCEGIVQRIDQKQYSIAAGQFTTMLQRA